jgi:Bacterial Ig-like domain (group 2)
MRISGRLRFISCCISTGLIAALLFGMTACLPKTPAPTLLSIAVSPASPPNLAVGSMLQFTATGTYSDNSSADITNKVTWTCDHNTISIGPFGIATGVAAGNANITAALSGVISPAVGLTTTPVINPTTGIYGNYYLGLVTDDSNGETLGGDGCYDDTGDFIVLINNKNAANPTYAQLVSFLKSDKTDEYPYTSTNNAPDNYYGTAKSHVDLTRIQNIIDGTAQPDNPDVCSDFAERLHNDAEMAGLRCAYVSVDMSTGLHGVNAFQTTDKGLIYVDDTGAVPGNGISRCVKTVSIAVGQNFQPVSLFPQPGWNSTWDVMGTVISYQVTWDGTW